MSMLKVSDYIVKKKCKACGKHFETHSRTRQSCVECSPPKKH